MEQNKLNTIAAQFAIKNQPINIEPHGNGHINKSYKVNTGMEAYLLQQLNNSVFHIEKLDQNSRMATWQIFEYRKEHEQSIENDIWFIPLKEEEDNLILHDGESGYWRMMNFIPKSTSYDAINDENMAFEAAKKFGEFIKILSGEDVHDYEYPIENFQSIEWRLKNLEKATLNADHERKQKAADELSFVRDHTDVKNPIARLLRRKQIPLGIVHNDTKINNVLFNKYTNKGLCVIDLDTVMPGSILFDFGDMVRTFTSSVQEDEKDLTLVHIRKNILKALTAGFMSEAGSLLTLMERQLLYKSGQFMTFMIGIRFLTDYLNGDIYYKTKYPEHNLDRSKNQFKLLESIIEQANDSKIP